MSNDLGTPLSPENASLSPSDENRRVEPLVEDVAPRAPQMEAPAPSAPEPEPEKQPHRDPRGEELNKIAERSNERRKSEDAAIRATYSKTDEPAPPPAPKDEDYVDLKVRRQTQRMTVRERNTLLQRDFDDNDIAAMPESVRNQNARNILALQSYEQDQEKLREELRAAKAQPQQIVVQQQPEKPAEPVKTVKEEWQANYDKALEDLEFGVDGARARVSEASQKLAEIVADERLQVNQRSRMESAFDGDLNEGFRQVEQRWNEPGSGFANDPVMFGTFQSMTDRAMRGAIAQAIAGAAENVQLAFIQSGITRDYIEKNATTEGIKSLYKDMAIKRYNLPQPSHLIAAVANHIESRLAGSPQPASPGIPSDPAAPNGQPPGLDRTDRKDGIANQPGRASIPRPQATQPQPVLSEAERARVNREKEKRARQGRAISVR